MSEDLTRILPSDDTKLILAQLQIILSRLDAIEASQKTLDANQKSLETRQAALEEKVDRRLQETRPIWEAVLVQIIELKERQQKFEEDMLREMKRTRRDFTAAMKMESQVNADFRGDTEERLDELEGRNAA